MLQRKKLPIMCGLLTALSFAAGSVFAGGSYQYSVIAQTGGSLAEIIGASLNNAGTIIFDGLNDKGEPSIHDANAAVLDSGYSSTLNDGGDIFFVRHVPQGKPQQLRPAIFKYDDIVSVQLLGPSSSLLSIGQLSANTGGDLAFWTFKCCAPAEMCITTREDSSGDVTELACAGFGEAYPCSVLAGPAVNDSGHVAYLRECNNEPSIALEKGEASPVVIGNPETNWLMGAPSLNNDSDIAFIIVEGVEDGNGRIYVRTDADETLTERLSLSGDLRPSLFTSVVMNDAGDLAFAARVDVGAAAGDPPADWREVIMVLEAGQTDPLVVAMEGDDINGITLTGSFQVLGFNVAGDVLFKSDGASALRGEPVASTVLVLAEPDVQTTCLGDLNNSGAVDVQDLLILLGSWGPCPGCPADLNDSGAVDVQDLLILLGNWGPCP